MVLAILEGRKTQTRRIVKDTGLYAIEEKYHGEETAKRELSNMATQCPHGQPGDRLWVKETFQLTGKGTPFYRADFHDVDMSGVHIMGGWKPSIFMRRIYSRLTLEITGIKAERLQDISEEDAKAEGVIETMIPYARDCAKLGHDYDGRNLYKILWDSLNAKRGFPWESNPWVWAITFKRINP